MEQFGSGAETFYPLPKQKERYASTDVCRLPIALDEVETARVRDEIQRVMQKGERLGEGQTASVYTYDSPFFKDACVARRSSPMGVNLSILLK
ncbi:MAG: hypothetical protein HY981_02875 [Candidatus Magasanikbacteria bacterium]|nr:hypothetical protein [Candidatus Magasanikbacteria bacterium]